jgi:pimeloyl-ACP methyl ester carboxylesterase
MYGRSLGGVVASHVAATYPNKIDLIIADRTFGNLKDVSTRKFRGEGTSLLFDLITFKWETDNDLNYIKVILGTLISNRLNASKYRLVILLMMLLINMLASLQELH